jgi:hypothetical protein
MMDENTHTHTSNTKGFRVHQRGNERDFLPIKIE